MIFTLPLLSCGGTRPDTLGLEGDRLHPCPDTPNCVCSDDHDSAHYIAPLQLDAATAAEIWMRLQQQLRESPRTVIVSADEGYLHAEAASPLMGFVDDLEFHLRPEKGEIALRSGARIGYSDFGVNRRRLEALRQKLFP
ncbi:MAG: DUF1499 domain-containing protein [Gammaproteobacteria bacterium]|nr:DUF1499 domain-containing protein [Gammaproteobacteria bacterium]